MMCVVLLPDLNVIASFMRPESFVALLAVILFLLVSNGLHTRFGDLCVFVLSLLLVFTHVVGPVVVGGFLLAELIRNPLKFKNDLISLKWCSLKSLAIGLLMGVVFLSLWFFFDESRASHFTENLIAQRSSNHSIIYSAKLCFFSDINGVFVLILFATFAGMYIYSLVVKSNHALNHYAIVPIACLLFSLVTQNPNRCYLACVTPLLLLLFPVFLNFRKFWCIFLFASVLMPCSAFQLKRVILIVKLPDDDIRKQMRSFLLDNHNSRLRIIPPSLWETAAELQLRDVRLYTFPNVASLQYRLECEKNLWGNLKNGDLFIFDETSKTYASDYFHDDVLARLRIIDPKQVGSVLQEVEIRGLSQFKKYSVIQITNEVYIQQALKSN